MKNPQKRILSKMMALFLTLTLCLAPAVQALTADELKTLLQEYYLDDVSDAVLKESSIEGIIKALNDPYTQYMSAEYYQAFLGSMSDTQIGGIGITATSTEKGLLIESVFEQSPAEAAGLKAGDIITQVASNVTQGQDADTITEWLRGEVGTEVSLSVLHVDGSTTEYKLVRQVIIIPATTSEFIEDRVGYINCRSFGEQTAAHFLEALDNYPDARVWVVDLRANLGGDVQAATQSLGTFVGKGNIAYLRDGKDQYVLYQSTQEEATLWPTIVLTSSYTASAAEIFSAVIRDDSDGLLIGERTFGKGVAQVLLDAKQYPSYFKEGDAVKITAFRYFTPSGTTADHVGVIPHLMVDAVDAGNIALLLTEKEPFGAEASHYLFLALGRWGWYLDVTKATTEENRPYLTKLLEALPPEIEIQKGTEGGTWEDVAVADLVSEYQLADYQSRSFSDVADHPYETAINTLGTYGIVKGKQTGKFDPNATMTRAELCALLVQALELPVKETATNFSDVAASAWYADEVNAVQAAGLMQGIGDGKFWPQGTVTEQQLITVIARVGTKMNAYLYESVKNFETTPNSVPERYSDWARESVWLLTESQITPFGTYLNLLFARPDQINPQQNASRAEAAQLLYNVLAHINILPEN